MHIYWLIILDNLYNLLTFTSLNFLNCKKQICMGGFLWGLQIVHELLPCPDSANNCQYHISLITQIIIAQIITTETLPTKVHIVKALVFPVVMYGCESWTIKKAEHWRIDAFELCCWRRLLRVPRTARKSNQSSLQEISPKYSWMDWCGSWSSKTLAT